MDTINTNSREYKHEHRDKLCYCCDEVQENKSDIIKLSLSERGYGSTFDGSDSYIQLCRKCLKPEYIEWFNEIPEYDKNYYCEDYKHEDDIRNLVNSFPLENQEYFYNSNCTGWNADRLMNRQDWLDMMNGIMTDEKYKEYQMYSPSEIKAYEERFPTCGAPVNIICDDNSKGCRCLLGAFGEYGQKIDEYNPSDECLYCECYKKRENPIKDITDDDYEKLEKAILGKTSEERLQEAIKEFKQQNKINTENL